MGGRKSRKLKKQLGAHLFPPSLSPPPFSFYALLRASYRDIYPAERGILQVSSPNHNREKIIKS